MLRGRSLCGWTGEVTHTHSGHPRLLSLMGMSRHECVCVFVNAHRAPVLVALALIESGMKYEDAIQLIRQ